MTIIKKNASTEKVIGLAADRLQNEVAGMQKRSESAMSVFHQTVSNLEAINNDLRIHSERARHFAALATEKADEADLRIAENNAVCQKIYEIIGKTDAQ